MHHLEAETQSRASVEVVANLVMQVRQKYILHSLFLNAHLIILMSCLPFDPSQLNYQNKDHLVGALIIAGYDEHKGGQVFGCPIGGSLSSEKWAIDGSGSTFIWAYCDSEYRWGFFHQSLRMDLYTCSLTSIRTIHIALQG